MIYVDIIRNFPECKLRHKQWCHMVSDTSLDELHAMAAKIGLKREWFQDKRSGPHYDLTPSRREAAIRQGAQVITDAVEFLRLAKTLVPPREVQ